MTIAFPMSDYDENSEVIPPDAEVTGLVLTTTLSGFGSSISLTHNGSRLAIGAPHMYNPLTKKEMGATYIFERVVIAAVSDGVKTSFPLPAGITPSSVLRKVTVDLVEIPLAGITVNSAIVLSAPVVASSIIRFEFDNIFEPLAKLSTGEIEAKTNFGASVAFDGTGNNLAIGAPLSEANDRSVTDSGSVHRFVDQGAVNGQVQARVRELPRELFMGSATALQQYNTALEAKAAICMVPGARLLINDFPVTFTGVTLESVVADIKAAKIPGIMVAATGTVLTLQTDKTLTAAMLRISGLAATLLGLNVYVKTQKIVNPNAEINARFGSHVSMDNTGGKLAISSPTGTTVRDMRIDAGNTMFDDKSTVFCTQFAESGAVYVYQCLQGGATTFTPIIEMTVPDNGGGGGGGGGGDDGPPDTTGIIFRDTFSGAGKFTSAHIPDIGNSLCIWNGLGQAGEMGMDILPDSEIPYTLNVDFLRAPGLELNRFEELAGPPTLAFSGPAISGERYSSYDEIKPTFVSKPLDSFTLKIAFKLTDTMSGLRVFSMMTNRNLFTPQLGNAISLPFVLHIGASAAAGSGLGPSESFASETKHLTIFTHAESGMIFEMSPVITLEIGIAYTADLTWDLSTNTLSAVLGGTSISLVVPPMEYPGGEIKLNTIAMLMLEPIALDIDLLEITGIESATDDVGLEIIATDYLGVYLDGKNVNERDGDSGLK